MPEAREARAQKISIGPINRNWPIIISMDLFPIAKTSWSPGDTREVEQSRVRKEIGMEYDSYRRIYIADGHEWTIVGQIARDDGKKYYILECVG
jgi:hypothetical protein